MSHHVDYDVSALKKMGLLKQREGDLFSVRVGLVGGALTADQLRALADLAERHGQGHVHLTTRQGVEIPDVEFPAIADVSTGLARAELGFAACGARVRTITACRGGSCLHGLIDPQDLARKISARVAGRADLPHKFKIGLTGCPNSCIKPQENDLGIMGVADLAFDPGRCGLCGLCVEACRVGALEIAGDQLLCDGEKCLDCGACAPVCPTGAWELTGTGYALFVGGKIGRVPRLADRLPLVVTEEAALLEAVDAVLDWYIEHGRQGERLGCTIDRVGLEGLVEAVAHQEGP